MALRKRSADGALPGLKSHAVVEHPEEGQFLWHSRENRKKRHHLETKKGNNRYHAGTGRRLLRVVTAIEYWNISWWIAMLFTLGSIVWCINGFYVFLPFVQPSVQANIDAGGWTAWVGATIFEFGAILAMIEAFNTKDDAYFGWAVQRLLAGKNADTDVPAPAGNKEGAAGSDDAVESSTPSRRPEWQWYSTDTKFWHDIGFVSAFIQLWAASIFWIAGWTSLPVIFRPLQNNSKLLAGVFWTPQVIGGTGFVISGTMYMLENQRKWYIPSLTSLGWHVGFWNMLGGVGFTICPIFGYSLTSWRQYQSGLSTFWGAWAFLIGSVIALYEAVNPVPPTPAADAKQEDTGSV